MRCYAAARRVYHALVPERIRKQEGLARVAGRLTSRFADHDLIYSDDYYREDTEPEAAKSAPLLSGLIYAEFRPARVIDVGCGTGALLAALKQAGCETLGLEYSEAGLNFCRTRGLDVRKFNLERDVWTEQGRSFDVVTSIEVAEHLPAPIADSYVALLTRLAPVLVFTAATPGQGGVDHVNEQPHEYWIRKFEARGHQFDPERSERWRRELREAGAANWYSRNLMIFQRRPEPA